MKKVLLFIIILFCWLLGGLIFKFDEAYYSLLNIPKFVLSPTMISITWLVIYLLITYSITLVLKKNNIFRNNDYLYVLITNYLSNMFFSLMFFTLKSPFFGFLMTIVVTISSFYLYIETKSIDKKASYFLIPYLVFNIYSLFVSFFVYVMNF